MFKSVLLMACHGIIALVIAGLLLALAFILISISEMIMGCAA